MNQLYTKHKDKDRHFFLYVPCTKYVRVYQGKGKCRQFSSAFCGASQYFSIFFIYLKFTVKTFTKFSNSSLKSLLLPHKREIEKMLESVARPIHPKALMKIDWHFPFPENESSSFFRAPLGPIGMTPQSQTVELNCAVDRSLCGSSLTLWCPSCYGTNSVVSCPPRSLTLRCPSYHGVWLCGVLPTTESDFAVSFIPRSLTLRCPAYHRVWLCSVGPTTESDSAVSVIPRCLTQPCPAYYGVWLCGLLHTTESDSAVSCLPQSLTLLCPSYHGVWLCCVLPTADSHSQCS